MMVSFFLVMPAVLVEGQLGGPLSGSQNQTAGKVKIELVSQYAQVGLGQKFALAVVLDIPEGWHLYAHPRRGELGIDTEITPQQTPGLRFGKVLYPQGNFYEDKVLGASNYIYEGRQIFYLPIEVVGAEDVPPGADGVHSGAEIPVRLKLKGLLCSDAGSCVPWQEQAAGVIIVSSQASTAVQQLGLFGRFDINEVEWGSQAGATTEPPKILVPAGPIPVPAGPINDERVVMPDYQPREFSEVSLKAEDWFKPILLALAAGVLLNLMPCVLPVNPLKVLSLIQQAQADRESGDKYKAVKLSAVFSIGIVLVFVGLAVVMSVFKILYGQQFQSNAFKFVMMVIIYVLGLSMFGLFEVALPSKVSNIRVVREGYAGALGMGVLATLLATPCSAPLLGPVLTWSLSKPTTITVAVFIVVGIGMAGPYVILTAFPQLLNRIPKAGNWMIRLKQGLGFVMLGVTVYLIFLFEPGRHLRLMVFCLAVALALWLGMQVVNASSKPRRRRAVRLAALLVVIFASLWLAQAKSAAANRENWQAQKQRALKEGRTVMVEFTADWCPNCKYVEKTVLEREAFKKKLDQTNTEFIIADWTHNDPTITKELNRLGSKSIPFSAIYPAKSPDNPILLRDIYTLDTVLRALEAADINSHSTNLFPFKRIK